MIKNKRDLGKEQSIMAITKTAMELFSSNGFKNTSVRAIALKAGVSPGLMYNYFKNKEDLLKQLFMLGMSDIAMSFSGKPSALKGKTSFEIHLKQTFAILKRKKEFWRLLHSIRMQKTVVKKLKKDIEQMQGFILKQLQQNLKDLGMKNSNEEAILLFAIVDGIAAHYLIDENYPLDTVLKTLIKKYIP